MMKSAEQAHLVDAGFPAVDEPCDVVDFGPGVWPGAAGEGR
jgi:hypothetical protein